MPLTKPEPITFEAARDGAASDLKAVADLFVSAAEMVNKGDLDAAERTILKMREWQQYLLVRHAYRLDCLDAGRTGVVVQRT